MQYAKLVGCSNKTATATTITVRDKSGVTFTTTSLQSEHVIRSTSRRVEDKPIKQLDAPDHNNDNKVVTIAKVHIDVDSKETNGFIQSE